ncbi:MAG TPA: hypothetical protein V6C85_38175 [Allocoleopsis sp.]
MTLTVGPLLNYRSQDHPNFGTVLDFVPFVESFSQTKIGDWRRTHPDCIVSIACGVSLSVVQSTITDSRQGRFLKIQGRGTTRFYWYAPGSVCGNVCWNQLLIPKRVIADYDENKPMTRQVHYPELQYSQLPGKNPPHLTAYSLEQLIVAAQRKLDSEQIPNSLVLALNPA